MSRTKTRHFAQAMLFVCAIFFITCIVTSCSGKPEEETAAVLQADAELPFEPDSMPVPDNVAEEMNYVVPSDTAGLVERLFTLDYTPEYAEPESPSGKVVLNDPARAETGTVSGGTTTSHIPGLRPLSNYLTQYRTKRLTTAEYLASLKGMERPLLGEGDFPVSDAEVRAASPSADASLATSVTSGGTFTVADWGPRVQLANEDPRPKFYVEFSAPVVPLSALDSADRADYAPETLLSITPALTGTYRWNGTRMLAFESDEPPQPGTTYTIKIDPSLTASNGASLTGTSTFTVSSSPLALLDIYPGYRAEDTNIPSYSDTAGIPKEKAAFFAVKLNSYLSEADAQRAFIISFDGKSLPFTLAGEFNTNRASVFLDRAAVSGNRTNLFYLTITDASALRDNGTVTVSLSPAFAVQGPTSGKPLSFNTLKPFTVTDVRHSPSSYSGYQATITCNQNIDKNSVLEAIEAAGVTITEDNFSVWRNELYLSGLKVRPGDKASITVGTKLRSTAGAALESPASFDFVGGDYAGYARFVDSGNRMVEAQFPSRLLIEYMNAYEGSAYKVSKTNRPLEQVSRDQIKQDLRNESTKLDVSKKNVRLFEEIDLVPYLENGHGFVRFEAAVEHFDYDWRGNPTTSTTTSYLNLQVTDLAATVRYGVNRVVVLVRRLSDDAPVPDAEVWFSANDAVSPHMRTDENGLALFELDPANNRYFRKSYYSGHEKAFTLFVRTDDDAIRFMPSGHNAYRSGVYNPSPSVAYEKNERVFLFCDRGLYKPGETITFRGIDRTQSFGSFVPYQGKYTITLEKRDWRDPQVYETRAGDTTASGGFWGNFELPADLEPDTYYLTYKRDDSTLPHYLTFQTAYFEKVRIQSSLAFDEAPAVAGESISASLEASYLAGGFLSGAAYEGNWYKEPFRFAPSASELKSYSFGLVDLYDMRRHISEDSGVLNSSGRATLSLSTGDDYKGIPYTYRLEASVTDVSNQKITASAAKPVHPASYYIGIGKPLGLKGFAKKGEEATFPVVLCGIDGALPENTALAQSAAEYELRRTYWSYDLQNSVNDTVYYRWERHIDTEKTGTFQLTDVKNRLAVTPNEAGWYTLRVTGTDMAGRKAISEYEFYVTGSGATWGNNGDASTINLTPDQGLYNPGDTAQILVESPLPKGDYLITVEREGIFTQEVRHFDESCNVIEVPIARNYLPVVYVSVSSYSVREGDPTHEYGERDMGKPAACYGVTTLYIDPQVRAFSVKAETDKKVYKPGDRAKVTLTATRGGKPVEGAEITVMGVDRAVLDLISYHVPSPIEFFYRRGYFPLAVNGGDSREYLMDPVTYSIKSLQGGDSDDDDKDENERKDFRPTAFFEPSLVTGADGTVTCEFAVPDSLTTYRLTAFGVKGEYLALKEDEFAVQNPVNAQTVQPRRLRERDTAECGVSLTNTTGETETVNVSISVREPSGAIKTAAAKGLKAVTGAVVVDGVDSCTVTIAPGETAVAYFDVAAEAAGDVELVYSISSADFSDRLVSPLTIEKTYVMETVSLSGATDAVQGGTASVTERVIIPAFAEDGVGELTVTLDATRLGLLSSSARYLFDYPYGCMEQRTSRVLPLVIFGDYIDVIGMSSKVDDPRQVVASEMADWASAQLSDGGFPYWPENRQKSDYYVSLRVAHAYAVALANGYSAGYSADELGINIQKLTDYLVKSAPKSERYLAYACYVFSLLGNSGMDGTLEALFETTRYDDLYCTAYCGLAYAAKADASKGDTVFRAKAKLCADILRAYMKPNLTSVDMNFARFRDEFYLSKTGLMAVSMQLLVTLDPADAMVDRLLYTVLSRERAGFWSSTATTAQVLESVGTYIKARNLESLALTGTADLNGVVLGEGEFEGVGAKPISFLNAFGEYDLEGLPRDCALPLTVTADGKGTLYYKAELSYALPDEMQSARDEGFSIAYTLSDYKSGKTIEPTSDGMVYELENGTTYKVQVKLSSPQSRQFVALRVPIPSGGEILDSQFATTGSEALITNTSGGYLWSNIKIYDNEVRYFWDAFSGDFSTERNGGERTVEFTFRTARRGVYPVTPIQAECMYESEVFGRTDGFLYTIR